MTKIAALKTTNLERVRTAKRAFFVNLLDMSWKLLGAMLLPILLGAYLDSKFETGQTLTIIGVLLSFVAAALVIRSIVKKLEMQDV